MLEFTRILYELFVKQKLTLSHSLLIMRSKPKADSVSRAASVIYADLENGSLFSNALKKCGFISFDQVYISFISVAEKNGDLRSALLYLKQKLERENECKKKIVEASIYPIFVILLSISASVFIGMYTQTADYILLAKYVFLLLVVCSFLYFLIIKMLEENSLFEAFTAVDFLLQNGIELSEAVGCAVQIAGPSSKIGKLFESARIKLSYGMDLQNAFCSGNTGNGIFDVRLKEAFYYADVGGSKNDLFGRIASYLKSKKEKSRAICFSLIEPVFIVVAGGFILVILLTFFMPLINGVGVL